MRLTNTKAIFLSFIISTVALADAVIFNGDYVKALKDKLKLNETAEIITGTDDPTSVAKTAHKGSLYLRQGDIGQAYVKLDDGSSTNWSSVAAPTGILTYVLTNANSDISTYYALTALPAYTVGAAASVPVSVTTSETLLASFATNVGYPNTTIIPSGILTSHFETTKASGGQSYTTRFRLYKRSSGGAETLLITSDNTTASTANTAQQQSPLAIVAADITLDPTDRLVMKVFATMASSSATISLGFDGSTSALLRVPAGSVDATNFVPYVGATKNIDIGAKDLTTTATLSAGSVSATNSSASSQFLGAAGSLGTPSYSFTGDPNTGLASSGADSMTVSAGGTNVASFESTLITANQPLSLFTGTTTKFPMKFTAGTNLTSPVPGAIEYDGTNLYYTDGTSTRRTTVNTNGTQTLTGKTLNGNTATNLVSGSGTFTLNTSGTVTAPNATDTLVGKATTDTLTNKTLTAPAISDPTVTGQVNAAVGNAAAPTVSFTSDLNTGIFSPTADTVGISTGGTSRATVDTTSVNLLAGTNLKLNGSTSGTATIATPATTTSYTATLPSAVGDVQSDMVFDSSGNAQFLQQKQRNYLSPWFDGNKTITVTNSIGDTIDSSDRTPDKTTWGAGNTSNLTVSNSTSSPIEGANSVLVDSGSSTAGFIETPLFSITNTIDLGKPLSVTFDTTGNATDANYQVYVVRYDSAEVLRERIPVQGPASTYTPYSAKLGVGATKFKGFFIPSSTSTDQYAIRWSKDAPVDVDIKLDSLYVGPDTAVQGAAITDWASIPLTATNTPSATGLTISGATTAPTFGTGSNTSAWTRRVGDSAEFLIQYSHTGAGTAGSGAYAVVMPTSMVIDTAKTRTNSSPGMTAEKAFSSKFIAHDGTNTIEGTVQVGSSSTLIFRDDANTSGFTSTASANFGDTAFNLFVSFSVPIVGWSSNVTMANREVEEYLSYDDSGATAANTTYSTAAKMVYGNYGSPFYAIASTTAAQSTKYRITPQKTLQPSDTIMLVFSSDSGKTFSTGTSIANYVGYSNQADAYYGMYVAPNYASNYIEVGFGNKGRIPSETAATAYGASGRPWNDLTGGTYRWAVKVISGGAAVGYPVGARNIVGDTSGTTVPAGIVGERIAANISAYAVTASEADVTGASVTLTPGVWLLMYSIDCDGTTGAVSGNAIELFTKITDSANVEQTGTRRRLYAITRASATVTTEQSLSAFLYLNLTASATYKIRAYRSGSGANIAAGSTFEAFRIN